MTNAIVKFQPKRNQIYAWDALQLAQHMPSESVNCIVSSPPYYGLRDYGVDGQTGLEDTPEQYVASMVRLFRELRRVLRDDGTLWLNLGDSYVSSPPGNSNTNSSGLNGAQSSKQYAERLLHKDNRNHRPVPSGWKPKDLIGIPFMVAFALRADGWYLRSDIIWSKPNPMPESVTDRPTKAHEYIFLLSKSPRYFYDGDAIRETAQDWGERDRSNFRNGTTDPKLKQHGLMNGDFSVMGRNRRTVWEVTTKPFHGAHFATFPEDLIEPMILAGCPKGGLVYDPFMGVGTTGLVAQRLGRDYLGSELNPEYAAMARARIDGRMNEYLAMKAGKPYMEGLFTETA